MQTFGSALTEGRATDVARHGQGPGREGELAAEALGVAEATHGAHGEPEGSMPEREFPELPMSATERVEAPRHQVRSEKPNGRNCYSSRLRVRYHDSPSPPRGIAISFTQHRVRTSVREPVREL